MVSDVSNPMFYSLLKRYSDEIGIPLLINTSFNKSGEPIVETPLDAIKSFREMDLDALVMGKLIIKKKDREHTQMFYLNHS